VYLNISILKMMRAATSQVTEKSPALEKQARELVTWLDALTCRLALGRSAVDDSDIPLTYQEFRTLLVIGQRGCSIMTDLAEALEIPLSTATHMVDRLVRKGYAVRRRSEEDRRVVQVELSEKGKTDDNKLREIRVAMGRDMLLPLSPGEREIFLELMAKMASLAKRGPAPK
jgi:DNA-binding MarR family transcriptional regulator